MERIVQGGAMHLGSAGRGLVLACDRGRRDVRGGRRLGLGDLTPGNSECSTDGGTCTLRAAVEEANALASPDDVVLPAGAYGLLAQFGAAIEIKDALTIIGASARTTVISQEQGGPGGGGVDRVFDIAATGAVVIERVTVMGGAAFNSNGYYGGNIRSSGSLVG